MSLQSNLQRREVFIGKLLKEFDTHWDKLAVPMQKQLNALFMSDKDITVNAINKIFQNNGYSDVVKGVSSQFPKMMTFSRDMADEIGYKFLLTSENIKNFDTINNLNIETMLGNSSHTAVDLKRFAMQARLEGQSLANMRAGLIERFETMGRRLNTEIYTGVRMYESAIDLAAMKNAGIELYEYVGPLDGKTRGACLDTLHSNRQATGWTMAQIEESLTPFIQRGGWNCRHRWMAFV